MIPVYTMITYKCYICIRSDSGYTVFAHMLTTNPSAHIQPCSSVPDQLVPTWRMMDDLLEESARLLMALRGELAAAHAHALKLEETLCKLAEEKGVKRMKMAAENGVNPQEKEMYMAEDVTREADAEEEREHKRLKAVYQRRTLSSVTTVVMGDEPTSPK